MNTENRKGVVFTAINTAEFLTLPCHPLSENEVGVRMSYTAVSGGTERACITYQPNTVRSFPEHLGYSGSGIVEEVGKNVKSVKPGDRVIVYHGFHTNYNIVGEDQVFPITYDDISMRDAAFILIASMGLGGLRKTKLEFGEAGMVFGMGILGIFALKFMKLSGAVPVIAADLSEKRRRLALNNGADYAFDPRDPQFIDNVKQITGGHGASAIVEVTGSAAALKNALECAAVQARVSLLGCTRVSDCPIDYYQLVHCPGISLIGAHNFVRPKQDSYDGYWTNRDDCMAIMDMLHYKRTSFDTVISEIADPSDAPAVYYRLINDPDFPTGIAFDWGNIR